MARRLALLIGMSEYGEDLGRLVAPPEDVALMARVLGSPELGGFEILGRLVNADQGAVGNAIASFFGQAQRDDLLLLYFSGHGITDDAGKLYLATSLTTKNNYVFNSISASSIHTLSEVCRARRQVMVLDCCFSGAFAEGWRAKGGEAVDVRQILGTEGRVVLTSSTATQKSFEFVGSEGSNSEGPIVSLYTKYFAEGIETGAADDNDDGCIFVRELHDYAKAKVQEAKPAMTPDILVDRQGYEIKIANARRSPERLFREKVEGYLDHERGELSLMVIEILANFRQRLALTEDSAQAIIDSLLGPIRQRNHNVARYRQQLEDLLARAYPLTERVERELHDWQEQVLGLADGDVAAVRSTLLAVAERDRLAREAVEREQAERDRFAREQVLAREAAAVAQASSLPTSSGKQYRISGKNNWAITIGINQYTNLANLKFADRDAVAVRDFLQQELAAEVVHFGVDAPPTLARSGSFDPRPTFGHLRNFLRRRFEQPFLRPENNLWFFFSGHGVRWNHRDYLMASDSDPRDPEATALHVGWVVEQLRRSGAGNVLLFLEACRDAGGRRGGVVTGSAMMGASVAPLPERRSSGDADTIKGASGPRSSIIWDSIGEELQQGVVKIFACSPQQASYELEELQQGAFTHALLEGLRLQGAGNCATVDRLWNHLLTQVPALTQAKRSRQTPYACLEPLSAMHLILLPRQATIADTEPLRRQALRAERHGRYAEARALWIRVLAVLPADAEAIEEIEHLSRRAAQPAAIPPPTLSGEDHS